ncbi:hypothetical protein FJ959_18280 [Mesorhizobium sp. B2-2-4]|uniref:hypothetical protein n=1 Tax=unclassified Mesorhizobium TaxID=325217 RepID=UPI00112874E3|nr:MULTISPECIES: hypothetical protein [unclassified Mesorhizobium]TPM55353.1 hypothetical protein FJ959_18280 [Mesorhizobium sp. B2-2-4]TPM66320.1 hypothetical protein FJ965_14240 [Mesorhizobium sp. B2-2-1]TPN60597.1 hypothetical protein FJ984_30540 [Mesorhizobium sp. B1-1-3]
MFSQTIREHTRGNRVHLVVLGEFQFVSGTMYLHNEGGILRSNDTAGAFDAAIDWKGLQGLATVSGLGASKVGSSRQVTCSLNAEDVTIKTLFADQQAQVKGRRFRFWGQFYDADLQPLDPRFHLYTGTGDRLRMTKTGPSSRQVDLLLEDFLVRRRRSANSMITNTDQQSRDPGSTGFMYVNQMVDKTLNLFDARS